MKSTYYNNNNWTISCVGGHPIFNTARDLLYTALHCDEKLRGSNDQDRAGRPLQRALFSLGTTTITCALIIAATEITVVVITVALHVERAPTHPQHRVDSSQDD